MFLYICIILVSGIFCERGIARVHVFLARDQRKRINWLFCSDLKIRWNILIGEEIFVIFLIKFGQFKILSRTKEKRKLAYWDFFSTMYNAQIQMNEVDFLFNFSKKRNELFSNKKIKLNLHFLPTIFVWHSVRTNNKNNTTNLIKNAK